MLQLEAFPLLPRRKIKRALSCLFCVGVLLILYFVVKPRKKEVPDEIPNRMEFNFTLMMPIIEPKLSIEEKSLYMVVIVNTAAGGLKHRGLRTAIRDTWGNNPLKMKSANRNVDDWKVFYLLGQAKSYSDNFQNHNEAEKYNDILIGNFTDHYYNIATKTFMGHYWVLKRLKFRYVLKTDDDVYVRIPQTIEWLESQGSPRRFYGGYVEHKKLDVIRDVTDKWYITKEQYGGTIWPPYCHGAFHVLSYDIVPLMISHSRRKKPPFTDDAYIAVIMLNSSIPATPIPGYYVFRNYKFDCDLLRVRATGHKLTAVDIMNYHSFYTSYNEENVKWKCSFAIYRKFISKYLPILK